ncbi:MAG: aminotransferase class I/II-fold pyridoxal phosphate-dependent enzyme [Patescibacteria group bacterium]
MKTIFTSLAPNVEKDDAQLAFRLLFSPWQWKRGPYIQKFYETLKNYLGREYAFVFESGRTALYAILKCLDLKTDDEVLLQAFTCVAVPNAVLWAGAKPVYVDCNDSYTMSVEDLKRKITPRSKVLIIQHTFGIESDMPELMAVAREHKLFVIEDSAHALGLVKPQADAAFFSFGRDKIISSTFGGAVATNDPVLGEHLRAIKLGMLYPSGRWILQQLFYPIIMYIVRKTYDYGIGKVLLSLVRSFRLISKPVYPEEKLAKKPAWQPRRLPNAIALLALQQFVKLERFNTHRKRIASMYQKHFSGSGILRFALHANVPRQKGIFLGDWYTTAIAPAGVSYDAIGYDPSTCPNAERLTRDIINLPTDIHITEQDAQRIISTIKSLGAN